MEHIQIRNPKPKICLTIAGLDPSGGAGIIADINTFRAFGCFATAAVTSLTFQNTCGVSGAAHQTADAVRRQIEPLIADFEIAALKTGMLPTAEIIEETALIIKRNRLKNYVLDPVVRSTSGFDLIDEAALDALVEKLFPLCRIVTPNLSETEKITRTRIKNAVDIEKAARIIQSAGAENVLIKGGHLFDENVQNVGRENRIARDYLFAGDELHVFEAAFIETRATHGTGCTLAAAIAANLALGNDLIKSVDAAKKFVTEAIRTAPGLGHGNSPVNHSVSSFKF